MDSRLDLLADFGFNKDPFKFFRMDTTDIVRIRRIVSMAIDSQAMISITGERGYGKSGAIRAALADRENVVEIRVLSSDIERIKIHDIQYEMVLALRTDPLEAPRRSHTVRAHQVRRLAGEAVKTGKKNIVLILEESHRYHGQTLRSLKTLREMDWSGIEHLFTVIMIGQFDPMKKPGVDEVRLRTDKIEMKGLIPAEVKKYVDNTVGRCFEDDAVEAISRIGRYVSADGEKCQVRNFLELQQLLCELMDTAMRHGHKKVRVIDVFSYTGGGMKQLREKAGLTVGQVAEATGLSKTEISLVENGKPSTLTEDRVMATRNSVLSVVAKHMGEKKVVEEVKAGAA
jgi:type II secretory pathway predicted ATPase ExeA